MILQRTPFRAALLAAAAAVLAAGPAAAADSGGRTVTILASAAVNGETSTCGCKKADIGGLAKRATLIGTERAAGPALLVDAGDFGADRDFDPWSKTVFIFDRMAELGYDAVTPGESELLQGLDAARELYARHPDIRVVSANIRDRDGGLVWDESAIVEKDGVRFGVTGVTSSAFYRFNVTRGLQASDDVTFEDPREALARVLPALRERADVVVVLLHEGPADAKRTAETIEGMDVVIVGHNPGYSFSPDRAGGSLLVRPGNRGQYLSVLELTLGADGAVAAHDGQARPLGDAIADHPAIAAQVKAFEEDWAARKSAREGEAASAAPDAGR